MNLLMKGAALAPPFSCTTKYSSDVYSPRPPDIRVRLLPTKPPVHFTTEQPGRDNLGVDEQVIKKLHSYDWMIFNQNRQFYRHQAEFKDYSNQNFEWLPELTLTDVQAMLDNIDNQRLLQAIAGLDVMSQKIIFYRIEGYRNPEIASLLGISNSSVETKWWRLRKKLKKFL